MKPLKSAVSAALLAAVACAEGQAQPAAEERVRAALAQRFPEIELVAVRPAPWDGLYEVQTKRELVYANADGSRLFSGRILDTATRQDLTGMRWAELTAIDFASLPFELAVTTVRGKGTRRVAVFADPDCPYCRRLEQELLAVDDVTIHTFIYPIEQLHPQAKARSLGVLCSADPAAAWSDWMLRSREIPPAPADCGTGRLDALLALARRLGVESTPTLFFANGHRVPGALGAVQIEQMLARAAAR